ncbi:carboxypeptidase-like regulatory domain-containing protein [Gemmatimonadota bacterium]
MRIWWMLIGMMVFGAFGCSDFFLSADANREMTVKGTVTDASSGTPMEGVLVSLEWTFTDSTSTSAFKHIDTNTSADGTYLITTKLAEVNCNTLFLFFATSGYEAVRVNPNCRDGTQTVDIALDPD